MLVHYKTPKGVLCTGNWKIYGLATNMDPVDIPFEAYESLKGSVVDATYREAYLSSIFPGPFEEIAFRYDEIRYLPERTLHRILDGMSLEYDESWSAKRKIDAIKKAIRDASPA
jgi:hypothetical protein